MAPGFAVVLSLVLLPCGSIGATLPLFRREPEKPQEPEVESVHLTPHGDMARKVHHHKTNPRSMVLDNTHLTTEEKAQLAVQFCNYSFPLGKEGTMDCANPAHSIILEESMCIEAGIEAGAKTDHDTFLIGQEWEQKRPKGCFKKKCAENTVNHVCYFYNGNGANPTGKISGTPICSRPKYLLGKKNTNGDCGVEGYHMIQHEALCRTTAVCDSLAPGSEFRIGTKNASKHLEFPGKDDGGCFVDDDGLDGEGKRKVFYNKKTAEGFGKSPKGTPICIVSETVKWEAAGTSKDEPVDPPMNEHAGTGAKKATKAAADAAAKRVADKAAAKTAAEKAAAK